MPLISACETHFAKIKFLLKQSIPTKILGDTKPLRYLHLKRKAVMEIMKGYSL